MGTPLDFLGWGPMDESVKDILMNNKRAIFLFPHSTVFDMIIGASYLKYDTVGQDLHRNIRTIMNIDNLQIPFFSLISHYMGGIGVSTKSKKIGGDGLVNRVCKSLENEERFVLAMSPKGTIFNGKWRKGWYYMAKELDVPVIAIGLDYIKHTVVSYGGAVMINDMEYEEMEELMMYNMSKLSSYNPSQEPYSQEEKGSRCIMSNNNKGAFLGLFLLLGAAVAINKM